MTDRWNPKRVTVPTERPVRVFAAGDASGSGEVTPRGKTWGIRVRGDTSGTVVHAYRCPVHGVFDARVDRSDVPDEVACGAVISFEEALRRADAEERRRECGRYCGLTSPWAGSRCGIGHAAGEVMS